MPLTWSWTTGAGDGNRTRMTSLEGCRLRSGNAAYLALQQGSASDRETPLITVVNGTLMAQRSGAGRWRPLGVRPLRGSLPGKITL
jgi:hypothetical protein